MIDFHYWPTANGLKVGILLEELGLEYRQQAVNIRTGQQRDAAFQQISANGRIPAIVDHAPSTGSEPLSLFESGAILTYLADKNGRFVPAAGSVERQRVQEWLFWQVGHITPYLSQWQLFREKAPEPIPFALDLLQGEATRLYEVLERRLAQLAFVAGDYSIADMAIFPWIQPQRQGFDLVDYPAIGAWRERIKARPAVQRAYARGRELAPAERSLVLE
ncbi:glutathione S-transferase N-terminal domain-containing protein [Pseudomonas gingeri]|uniref:glutathione S-transferase N-terminal domain-containing protein n=1 Tax=Pseudomonas gingeri TaxID=117681 RepID=UPI0015A21411|nr:glutathione S-transferase N-terminal domain-containing protein [Pseudomonas gingeri]NWD06260.1 glutathione S-transferase N-terminal domain-containing protein [Pseudomonas gingeri]NWE32902.1 glutathione S-transferase N-terminal domain-containing protein [Pseudomonas gingeri]NWE60514.1 glutathione S-transferase N-terminal domain-containing protein [Pseudomonas gingeri]NWF04912.1 glutathione S-transferase N-terminal domain-containing protein [Pseudomonas gingeri]